MAVTPPPAGESEQVRDARFLDALEMNTAATLAAALITVTGRKHSPSEAAALARTMKLTLYPKPGSGIHEKAMKQAEEVHM